MLLGVLYFYYLLFVDVGSGVHVLHDNNIISKNETHASAPIYNGAISRTSSESSSSVYLEPRSLADISIANANVAWKRQFEHQNYVRRRVEKREEQSRQREETARLAKPSTNTSSIALHTLVDEENNVNVLILPPLSSNYTTTTNNKFMTKEEEDEYVKKLSKFAIKKRTPKTLRGRLVNSKSDRSQSEQPGVYVVIVLGSICTCLFAIATRLSVMVSSFDDNDRLEDNNDTTTNTSNDSITTREMVSTFFGGGGREARTLRRRARALRAQRQFQRFVDRLNVERIANGERPVSADTLRHLTHARDFTGNDYDRLHQFQDENGHAMGSWLSAIGATDAEINRCPSRTLADRDDLLRPSRQPLGPQQQTCSICLERYEEGETVRTIPCFHTFHAKCIDPWLATKSLCPVCKHSAIG